MTIRLKMLDKASLGASALGDSAGQMTDYVISRLNEDGGFKGKSDDSDLYYSVFGIESLEVLGARFPEGTVERYLASFEGGESLDFVHLACLARCWANLKKRKLPDIWREQIIDKLNKSKLEDSPDSAYRAFLAICAYQDLKEPLPDKQALLSCTANNGPLVTPVLAARAVALKYLEKKIPEELVDSLMSAHDEKGGFCVAKAAPLPDLLSTATALFALNELCHPLDQIQDACSDYVYSLWSSAGGFKSMAVDNTLDCEYAYYGLLALGCLH